MFKQKINGQEILKSYAPCISFHLVVCATGVIGCYLGIGFNKIGYTHKPIFIFGIDDKIPNLSKDIVLDLYYNFWYNPYWLLMPFVLYFIYGRESFLLTLKVTLTVCLIHFLIYVSYPTHCSFDGMGITNATYFSAFPSFHTSNTLLIFIGALFGVLNKRRIDKLDIFMLAFTGIIYLSTIPAILLMKRHFIIDAIMSTSICLVAGMIGWFLERNNRFMAINSFYIDIVPCLFKLGSEIKEKSVASQVYGRILYFITFAVWYIPIIIFDGLLLSIPIIV